MMGMDRDQLRSQAASRRSGAETSDRQVDSKPTWVCGYCSRAFVVETAFMSHRCREKIRTEQLRSGVGQSAYAHYVEWMKLKKHTPPPIETFAESKFYSTFIKFAEYAASTHIPNIKNFIRIMVEHSVLPALWSRDNTYAMYLQWYDAAYPPEVQVEESVTLILDICDDAKCQPSQVFKMLSSTELYELIRKRKLSPWFLLSSKVFRDHLNTLQDDERDLIQRTMNAGAMISRIQQDTALFKFFSNVTAELGL